jgi:hypothetical protein
MSTTKDDLERTSELAAIEHAALSRLEDDAGKVEADVDSAGSSEPPAEIRAEDDDERSPYRLAVATAFPVVATAIMVGGVFTGVGGRFYAGVAGLLGIALALGARRVRSPWASNAIIVVGLAAIGVLMVIPGGLDNVTGLRGAVSSAARSGDVLRPPVPLTPGWQGIIGWLMGIVGFGSAWVAISLRRPALSLLLPLPVAAVAGISVPKHAQVPSGIAVLALFAVGLGLLSSAQAVGEGEDRPPLAFEVRKALRSLPLIAAITVAMAFLAQAHFLFPKPRIDPTQQPQKPHTVPLSKVQDRVLFEVESSISGPWRLGSLDVYDGKDWRLPPYAQNQLKDVPRSGVVDPDLAKGVKATFTVAGLGGVVLPGLPNTVGILANGPKLAYDSRSGNIRVAEAQIQAGLSYTVVAAPLPSVGDLRKVTTPPSKDIKRFMSIPPAPPAVADLIDKAPKTSKWDEFDYLRTYVLDNVVAAGPGAPIGITPARVQDMLAGSKQASPFEIVAAQAMIARWIGLPSRIGYGFDGGDQVGNKLQVRPRNGSTFVEVYFPGYKWLPVIGTPKMAKPTVGTDASQQQFNPSVLPSNDIGVKLYLPVITAAPSTVLQTIRRVLAVGLPLLALLALAYATFPILRKAVLRARRRSAAAAAGPRARIALAYAEWRDLATDFGFRHSTDTPLMFLGRFAGDEEHTELAWLTTRALWGDLQDQLTTELAETAEELSRALRRRMAQAQPATIRVVALVSRLSLRHPYAPETDLTARGEARAAA